jgi:curved DNA-binding protein CbpA
MRQTDRRKDYYAALGADEDASLEEIEVLYKRLAVKHHPDRGGSEEKMKALNEAYSVLKDESLRMIYDAGRGPVEQSAPPFSSPSAQAEGLTGQCVGAVLCLAIGLFLLLLVKFQWMWFLWPLVILAMLVILMGIFMAHALMLSVRDALFAREFGRRHHVFQEAVFWSAVCGGGYGIYLVLRAF